MSSLDDDWIKDRELWDRLICIDSSGSDVTYNELVRWKKHNRMLGYV